MSEELARKFHDTYERLAPHHGYKTRRETAVSWEDVPENNRQLMIAVVDEVLRTLLADRDALHLALISLAFKLEPQLTLHTELKRFV